MSLVKDQPLVSVITSFFDAESVIMQTIVSVLKQSYTNLEMICINDGSSDNAVEILNKLQREDARVHVLTNDGNIGLTKSLNKGLAAAKGQYIARIDGGDSWHWDKLAKQIDFLENRPEFIICGTQVLYIDGDGFEIARSHFACEDARIRQRFRTREGIFNHSTVIFRNAGLYYNGFFKYSQDLELYARLSLRGKLYCINEILAESQLANKGITLDKKYYQRQYANIAYKAYNNYYLKGKQNVSWEKYTISHNKIGILLCFLSVNLFYKKFMLAKTKKKVAWPFFLFLAVFFYPPLAIDYLVRFYYQLKFLRKV